MHRRRLGLAIAIVALGVLLILVPFQLLVTS